jgi:hypothetical protein
MRKGVRWAAIGIAAGLIVIQFFQPEKNMAPADPAGDLLLVTSPPGALAELIRNSCYDCHSNQTNYPWYHKIAPVSWYLNRHITQGKREMNVSTYGSLDKTDKIELFVNVCEVVEDGTMPLASYTFIHKAARLGEEEREAICEWSEEEALKVMME